MVGDRIAAGGIGLWPLLTALLVLAGAGFSVGARRPNSGADGRGLAS